jgi:hypothetical protein
MKNSKLINQENCQFWHGDTLKLYDSWDSPVCIVSDGPYGIEGYEGDAKKPENLAKMYEPHIKAWSEKATSQTSLWFWNTEVGWASVHGLLQENGWIYRGCNIWDKGIDHIAGNCNGKTMRKFPVVTEVCVHYVRKESFLLKSGESVSLQNWLRAEWERSGLPVAKSNEACGVKNAASRKYLTKDHLWYFPPADVFSKLVAYANKHGKPEGFPYFSMDGVHSLNENQWERMRAKFNFEYGVTNVWQHPPLRSKERLKNGVVISHPNQKPLELMNRIVLASSDEGDVVWEPFAGTASASFAALKHKRRIFASEINEKYAQIASSRLNPENIT